jgi:AcrR family transcriptional regulator
MKRDHPADSRARLLAAAAVEFAARGYDAAGVDRIARTARLNKAMIYYHFRNKAALYTEICREFIRAVLGRVRAIAASPALPDDKIRQFVRAVVDEARIRPHFPAMWLREVAGGGRHLDRATIHLVAQLPEALAAIIDQGHAAGMFRRPHPLALHFSIVGPLMLYLVSQPVRAQLPRGARSSLPPIDLADLVAYVERATLATLATERKEAGGGSREVGARRREVGGRRQEVGARRAKAHKEPQGTRHA